MHVHISAVHLLAAFIGVVLIGTLWRLIAAHLAVANHPVAQGAGQAMAFQY